MGIRRRPHTSVKRQCRIGLKCNKQFFQSPAVPIAEGVPNRCVDSFKLNPVVKLIERDDTDLLSLLRRRVLRQVICETHSCNVRRNNHPTSTADSLPPGSSRCMILSTGINVLFEVIQVTTFQLRIIDAAP